MVKVIFTRPRLQCWSEPSGRLPDGLGAAEMAQTQRILCCDNIRDHSGLHFDRFFMDHPLRFSRYNVRVSGADLVVLAHFRSEQDHLRTICSLSIWGPWNFFSPGSEDVDN